MKKLTPAERKLDRAMLIALEYAQAYPNSWHDVGTSAIDRAAVEKLKMRGVVEVNEDSNQYRLKL